MRRIQTAILTIGLALLLLACRNLPPTTNNPPSTANPTAPPAATAAAVAEQPGNVQPILAEQPVQLRGEIELTSEIFLTYVVEYFVLLEDLTGFVQRDFEYEQPLEAQILGPVILQDDGTYTYVLNLPARPVNPFNDVDNSGQANLGVQIWQATLAGNLIDDSFLGENETGGWSTLYASARVDAEFEDEIVGGKIVVWSPDDNQQFPTGFGDDGRLFTADDPVGPLPAGYSVIDLDTTPFTILREPEQDLTLFEGDIQVKDLTDLTWVDAFEELFNRASREYPFTEQKQIDWPALYDTIQPRIARAEELNDRRAYYLALRDFAWAIPDGHVSLQGNDFGLFVENVRGGYGMAITRLSDGTSVVYQLVPDSPADLAGIEIGAQIFTWNDQPIDQAVAAVQSWEAPFSSPEVTLLQQYRYLVRVPTGTPATLTYQNPGAASPATITLTSVFEVDTFFDTSFYQGVDFDALPIAYETLPNGYGYIRMTSLYDDLSLIIRIWERALTVFAENEVPAVVIDLRQNVGGSPLGEFFAGYFTTETFVTYQTHYYRDSSGQFEAFGPPNRIEPDPDLLYEGEIFVLVSPACASACENVAYSLAFLPQTTVVGHYNSHGMYGEVGRGRYELPDGYSFQIPTGQPLDPDGNIIIEGIGVTPDIRVPVTLEALTYDGDYLLDWVIENLP